MSTTTIADRIADWVAKAQYEDLPRRVGEEAKNQILSVIASVHAGHFSEAGRTVSRVVKEWAGGKEATLIPSGERTSVHDAIFGNTALSMALDYDDYLFGAHTGHSAVLVTLALAEKIGISGKDFLLAQVLANEVAGRVGVATLLGPLSGQMCSHIHTIGSAVSAAKLLKLDQAQTLSAIGIAMLQPAFTLRPAFFGSEAKTLLASVTAPIGVRAAELASTGLRGSADVFEGDLGFLRVFSPHPLPGAFNGMGSVWLTETLSYKVYPGSGCVGAVVDCVLNLVRQHHIDARKVREVHVAAGSLALSADALSAPYVKGPDTLPTTLSSSLGYNVAAALMDKELSPRQFSRDRIKDAATWDLAARVRLTLDPEMERRATERAPVKDAPAQAESSFDLETADLNGFKMDFAARVRIDMEDGRSFELEQETPFGSGARPFDDRRKAVEDKFRRETRYTLRKERMEKAIDLVHHLEDASASHLRELVRLCCSERG